MRNPTQQLEYSKISVPQDNTNNDYFLPFPVILAGLGVTEIDFGKPQLTVNTHYLRQLITEISKKQKFDEYFYSNKYPDIEGARVAAEISSVHAHFVQTGYFEGRLPYDLAFDPVWYFEHYTDLESAYSESDTEGLRRHFFETGYAEGRAGTQDTLAEAERWRPGRG